MDTPTPHPTSSVHAALQELRARAEKRKSLVTQSLSDELPADVQRLVQDLQVHQIELEMQYEELLLTQAEAEASRNRFTDLYEFAPVGYCTVAANGTIEQLNLRSSQLLNQPRQQLQGRRLGQFVAPEARMEFGQFLARALRPGARQSHETTLLRADGTRIQVLIEGGAVEGEPDQAISSCRLALTDVTEQYQTRRALELSERRFRVLFERSQDGMLLMRDNRFVDCNEAALHLLGLRHKEELLGRHASAYSPEKQPNGQFSMLQANAYWAEALRRGHSRFEWCRLRASGEEFWEDILLTAIPDPGSDEVLVHATWRDVTDEKQANLRIRESEERLQMALRGSHTGVWVLDYTTNLVHWDARAQQVFGRAYDANPTPFQVLQEAIHPDDLPGVAAAMRRTVTQQGPFDLEHRIIWPDGSLHYVSAVGKIMLDVNGQPTRFVGLMRDVTERREAQDELTYKTRLLEHILANLPVVLSRFNHQHEYLELTGAALRPLQIPDNAWQGQRLDDVFPDLAGPLEVLLTGQPVSFVSAIEQAGQRAYFQQYGFFDEQRQQGVLFGIDVTESEQVKAQLRREEEFTRSLLDNSVDGILAFDRELRITAWNRVQEVLSDRSEEQVLGQSVQELFPEYTSEDQQRALREVLQGMRMMRYDMPFHHQEGHFESYFVPLASPSGSISGGLVIIRDVTDRVRMTEEATRLKLQQQQEVLAAILTTQEAERKRIAEALHNGVGQLLYAARLNLENRSTTARNREAALSLIDEGIRTTRSISHELTPGILEDFGLKIALQELVKRIPKQQLDVQMHLQGLERPLPRLYDVAVYRIVQELLSNIIKHAQTHEAFIHVVYEEGRLHISAEDNGVGFNQQPGDSPSKGIGLAGIRNRLDLLGGTLFVDSRPGKGSIITIEIVVK
ncbi:PAS domain S-box protein [Hymenobacter metallicola]|uniref:histidine kinase n=1 Tax=Hymenobacter metallicola TaxID=2563114 RepID=A0A4Z0QGU7_9BACT|nr:PAS domain S-box protein [Hymenobacter metallicola]TGE28261.1 PAS domain S-box protein [Hymenobacter metallicola]